MSILKEESGKWSSKRAMGVLYMVVLLVLFVNKELKELPIQSPEIFIGMVVTGGSLLGISIAKHFKRSDVPEKKESTN